MSKDEKVDRLQGIHERARQNYSKIQSQYKEERDLVIDDLRFYFIAGAQWEGSLSDQYENKPRFEINKTHLSIIKIINEYRNNRISVNFIPKKGIKNDTLADTLNGLFRADEKDSCADEAYDNAFEEAVGGGFGAFRLTNQYEDEFDPDDDEQRILIEPIYEAAKCVHFDLNAKKQDKSDAKYAYVSRAYTREDYEKEFNDSPKSWPVDDYEHYDDWYTEEYVYVAEYYEVEHGTETREIWETIDGEQEIYSPKDFEDNEDLLRILTATGTKKVDEKKFKTRKVHKYLMSGGKILEDLGYIPGICIPIIPVYGKRLFINNVERCQGHVRLAKDPQRIKNMQASKLVEISALSSVEKPIFTGEQVVGHENMWADDNIINNPYLLVNPVEGPDGEISQGPVGYTKVPQIPPALVASLQQSDMDIKEILGNTQINEKMPSNIAEDTALILQKVIDMQTYIYISNFAKSIKRCGEVWLSMAKELYVEEQREMKIIGAQDELSSVELSRPVMNKDTGKTEYENDLSKAKMGVTVSVGPSSESKRQSLINTLLRIMSVAQDPETLNVLSSMIMTNLEGEGLEQYRKFFRNRLLQVGAVEPTEEEMEQLEAQAAQRREPDANEQLLLSAAAEAAAKAQKAAADVVKTGAEIEQIQANTEKTKVETVETLSEMEINERNALIGDMQQAQEVRQPTSQAEA